jgi:hypothetical protein
MLVEAVKGVNEVVADILQKSLNAVQDGAIWLQGQLPDVIRQFILLHIAQAIFFICLGILIIVFGWVGYFKMKKLKTEYLKGNQTIYADSSGYTAGMILFAAFGSVLGSLFILMNLFDLLTLLIAPKIYLLEYVASLLSNRR